MQRFGVVAGGGIRSPASFEKPGFSVRVQPAGEPRPSIDAPAGISLPARAFHGVAPPLEFFHQRLAMVALNFDDAVLRGATGAAFLFELRRECFESVLIERNTRDDGHAFALASLGGPPDTDDAVALRDAFRPARALGDGFVTPRAEASLFGGIDGTDVFVLMRFHGRASRCQVDANRTVFATRP